jgi:hypoxanthine phosphoribosyltransferase
MNNKQAPKQAQNISWEEYGCLLRRLSVGIEVATGKGKFDVVVGIPRGGLPVAVFMSHHLELPMKPIEEVNGKRVLLVDDISDKGDTLRCHVKELESRENTVWTATIFYRNTSSYRPTFFLTTIKDDRWIVFPYESSKSKMERTSTLPNSKDRE